MQHRPDAHETSDAAGFPDAASDPASDQPPLAPLGYYVPGIDRTPAHGLAVIGCRLMALWLAFHLTASITLLAYTMTRMVAGYPGVGVAELGTSGLPAVLTAGFAALLWWRAGWLADRVVPSGGFAPPPPDARAVDAVVIDHTPATPAAGQAAPANATAATGHTPVARAATADREAHDAPLLRVALMLVGALVCTQALPELFREMAVVALTPDYTLGYWWRSPDWRATVLAGLFKVALAVWLLLGSRGVVRLIQRARHDPYTREDGAKAGG